MVTPKRFEKCQRKLDRCKCLMTYVLEEYTVEQLPCPFVPFFSKPAPRPPAADHLHPHTTPTWPPPKTKIVKRRRKGKTNEKGPHLFITLLGFPIFI